ncbi:glutathione peroxidase 1 [Sigmodon hispidus]
MPAGGRGACEPGLPVEQGTTTWDYTEIRDERSAETPWAGGLMVLGFPCNQFGHQENAKNEEILNSLKYIRPGGGFEPNFTLFEKCEVNGEKAHPLFTLLRESLPAPSDDPTALMTDPKYIIWSPWAATTLPGTLRSSWWASTVLLCAGTAAVFAPSTSNLT